MCSVFGHAEMEWIQPGSCLGRRHSNTVISRKAPSRKPCKLWGVRPKAYCLKRQSNAGMDMELPVTMNHELVPMLQAKRRYGFSCTRNSASCQFCNAFHWHDEDSKYFGTPRAMSGHSCRTCFHTRKQRHDHLCNVLWEYCGRLR